MASSFADIVLKGNHSDPRVAECMLSIASHLNGRGIRVLVDDTVELPFGDGHVESGDPEDMLDRADLVIAIGGDGTMLHTSRLAAGRGKPLLGINRGRLGFLTDVGPEKMLERIDEILAGHYRLDERLMLRAELFGADGQVRSDLALNDVVLQRAEKGHMLDFETWVNGKYVNTHGGDGFVVATATGSTAYALSCGGPIIQPDLEAIVLAPICPHTLSDRPIVVGGAPEVLVRVLERPATKARVSCDGSLLGDLDPGEELKVTLAETRVTLVHPEGYDYYRILRSKLNWGRRSFVADRKD